MAFGSKKPVAPVTGRTAISRILLGATLALSTSAFSAASAAENAADPCQAPNATVASAGPLPRLERQLEGKQTVRVLAIGSSSTAGVGASSLKASYPAQLEVELGRAFKDIKIVMVNRGVGGEIAETTAHRIKLEVALTKPDLVLWQVGTNDALSRIPIGDFARVVSRTVKWLKAGGVDVVIVGMQYTKPLSQDEHYKMMKDALKQVALEEGVPYVKRYEAMQYLEQTNARLSLMSDDQLHLNDLGYRCMAEHVARGILVSIFPKKPAAAAVALPRTQ
jgi:lysophospholipase L1-like esterase